MKLDDLETWEKKLMEEIVRRRSLGGYNADAPSIQLCAEALYEIVRHLKENAKDAKGLAK